MFVVQLDLTLLGMITDIIIRLEW